MPPGCVMCLSFVSVGISDLSFFFQLLAASIILFIGVMAVIGSRHDFPLSLGTPGLVSLQIENFSFSLFYLRWKYLCI